MPATNPALGLVRGVASGVAGTVLMTAAQEAFGAATGHGSSDAPAEGARMALEAAGQKVRRRDKPQLNALAHVGYGAGWGAVYSAAAPKAGTGVGFGASVWGVSLVLLPALGLSKPVWEQDPRDLAPDLCFHLVYGVATAQVDRALRTTPAAATEGEELDPAEAEGERRVGGVLRAFGLGLAGGARTMAPAIATTLRSGASGRVKAGVGVLAALELVGDKLPQTPSRTDPPGVISRFTSGTATGYAAGGPAGALVAGTTAVAAGSAFAAARAKLGSSTKLPDAVLAVVEDAAALGLAAVAAPRR